MFHSRVQTGLAGFGLLALLGCFSVPPTSTAPTSGGVANDYRWQLPEAFPPPRVPAGNPMSAAKVRLGRKLFLDTRLSGNQTFSCASCHALQHAFTDLRAQAVGSTGELHPRSSMGLTNVAYNASYTWADPNVRTLEDQMRTPLFGLHPVELGLAGRQDELVSRLEIDSIYPKLFAEAFPDTLEGITIDKMIQAIASFERTLIFGDSPYDRFVYLDESEALNSSAQRGMRLFFSDRLKCSECHRGFNLSGPIVFQDSDDPELIFHNTGLYNLNGKGHYPTRNRGLFEHTHKRKDEGKFRAPTLRNVALTAPYMHDGSIDTLEGVLNHYAAGGRQNLYQSPLIGGFLLTKEERADLLEFLQSLTDLAVLEVGPES